MRVPLNRQATGSLRLNDNPGNRRNYLIYKVRGETKEPDERQNVHRRVQFEWSGFLGFSIQNQLNPDDNHKESPDNF